ncbi:hypothetical protein Bca4012_058627 [Brassica carinata]
MPDVDLCAGNMSGSASDGSFAAYQEAAKVMSAKRGSASRTTSGDDVMVTGSQRAIMVKTEPTSLSQGRKTRSGGVMTRASHRSADADCFVGTLATILANLNLSVFPRDGTTISQLFHLGERLSTESVSSVREELEALKREAMEEKDRRVAQELEVRDLKEKLKASEKIADEASADTLAASQENQKLAKDIETAAEDFKLEMAMAVNGVRVVARWESKEEVEEEEEKMSLIASARRKLKRKNAGRSGRRWMRRGFRETTTMAAWRRSKIQCIGR